MDSNGDLNLLNLVGINIIRQKIICFIPSFIDINNLTKTCKLMKYYIEKEIIERSAFCYDDIQNILFTINEKYEWNMPICNPNVGDLDFIKDNYSSVVLSRSKLYFGEKLHWNNKVTFFISSLIKGWEKSDCLSFIKKLIDEFNINCLTRKDIESIEFICVLPEDYNYILFDSLRKIEHQNITRIFIPSDCFITSYSNNNINFNDNIFKGFPKLNELCLTCPLYSSNYIFIIKNKNFLKRIVKKTLGSNNFTIFFKDLKHDDISICEEFHQLTNVLLDYNVKVKFGINLDCTTIERKCNKCIDRENFFLPIRQYFTDAYSFIINTEEIIRGMETLKHFKNLKTLHLKFSIDVITSKFWNSNQNFSKIMGIKKLNNLKHVKFEFEKVSRDLNTKHVKLFYQFFKYICSMMPKSVEILEVEYIPNLDKNIAKKIVKRMPNIKLLKILCLSYKENDGLVAFKKLECFISYDYCPTKIPDTLKVLAFEHKSWDDYKDDKSSSEKIIKSYYDKFTKRITNNKNRFILFDNVYQWNLYKYVIQKYFNYF